MDAPVLTFRLSSAPLEPAALRALLVDPACGAYAAFEGWVRNHNEGERVTRLEYEAFEPLAVKEGEKILTEAVARFGVEHARCVHRVGSLGIGDLAVWVGVSAHHRDEAFRACRYIIDEVKHRVPIWKKEHYESGDSGWVNCERCATHAHGEVAEHAHAAAPAPRTPDYSRQMALPAVGLTGQAKLRAARVLVVGAGGLGVPVLQYLAGAGVGRIDIVDADALEASNLHRQTMYALGDVGRPKAALAADRLRALNPEIEVHAHVMRFARATGEPLVAACDLVIDCTDNFGSKFLLNDLCMRLGKPAVLSSVYQYEGQLQVVRADRAEATCLRCVWPEATRDGLVGNCAEAGVLGPVPGVFGSLQALEALKVLLDLPGQLADEVLVVDLLTHTTQRVRARRAAECVGGKCVRIPQEDASRGHLTLAVESLDAARAQGYQIVDVRDAAERAVEPAPGDTRHVPLASLLSGSGLTDPAGKYLLACATGKRSLAAAEALEGRGFREVRSLAGGLRALAARAH